jgi:hypothetical protein
LDAGVVVEAVDPDDLPELLPAIMGLKFGHHHREGDAVEWVFRTFSVHGIYFAPANRLSAWMRAL